MDNQKPFRAGYEYLLAYKITVPIYDYTVEFCRRCSSFTHSSSSYSAFPSLSSPRTEDQMVQASRSGMTNIAEGSEQESLSTYIKLAGVARGSLEELSNDYFSYARQNKILVWEKERARREIRESRELWKILNLPTLPSFPAFPSLPASPVPAVNLLLDLTKTACFLQDRLIASLKEKHAREGGFSENLLKKRLDFRNAKS